MVVEQLIQNFRIDGPKYNTLSQVNLDKLMDILISNG